MPRKPEPPRLHLRSRPRRGSYWVILDRGRELGTGCSERDSAGAEKALAKYLTQKRITPKVTDDLKSILIADVVNIYLSEKAPKSSDKGAWAAFMAVPIIQWWGAGGKTLAEIRSSTCDQYVAWRTLQNVSDQTARHELSVLRSAILYYHKEYGPLPAVPVVTLPAENQPRQDYWLTRKQVAERINAARRSPLTKHIARILLIGVYSGTRPGAICALSWLPSTGGGWFDLDSETLHRMGRGKKGAKKRYPPVRIHRRLLPHLRRWKRIDTDNLDKNGQKQTPITHVIHFRGQPVKRIHRAWQGVAAAAGHMTVKGRYRNKTRQIDVTDGPHICRHTAATWLMQSGVDLTEAAGYLGMTPQTLWEVYGHHHPDFQANAANASGRRVQVLSKKPVNEERTNQKESQEKTVG